MINKKITNLVGIDHIFYHAQEYWRFFMKYNHFIIIAAFLSAGLICAESFIVPAKKKRPKISAEDCCETIGQSLKTTGKILQKEGAIQEITTQHIEDIAENTRNAFLKKMNQPQLQRYHAELKEYLEQKEAFLKAQSKFEKFLHDAESAILR